MFASSALGYSVSVGGERFISFFVLDQLAAVLFPGGSVHETHPPPSQASKLPAARRPRHTGMQQRNHSKIRLV
jgi:hypothetical protein